MLSCREFVVCRQFLYPETSENQWQGQPNSTGPHWWILNSSSFVLENKSEFSWISQFEKQCTSNTIILLFMYLFAFVFKIKPWPLSHGVLLACLPQGHPFLNHATPFGSFRSTCFVSPKETLCSSSFFILHMYLHLVPSQGCRPMRDPLFILSIHTASGPFPSQNLCLSLQCMNSRKEGTMPSFKYSTLFPAPDPQI